MKVKIFVKTTTSQYEVIITAHCNHVLPSALESDLLLAAKRKVKNMNLLIPKISTECILGARNRVK